MPMFSCAANLITGGRDPKMCHSGYWRLGQWGHKKYAVSRSQNNGMNIAGFSASTPGNAEKNYLSDDQK
jgi:hypothetical protein